MLYGYPLPLADSSLSSVAPRSFHWSTDAWERTAAAPSSGPKAPSDWTLVLPPDAIAWYAWPHPQTPKSKRRSAALAQLDDVCLQPESERMVFVKEQGTTVWTGVVGRRALAALQPDAPPPSYVAVLLQPDAPTALTAQWDSLCIRTTPHEACIAFLQDSPATSDTTSPSSLWSLTPRWSWPLDKPAPTTPVRRGIAPMYALPLLAGLLLANAIVLQYNAWSTQRTAQRLEHEARTLVQTTWRIPMVLDPVAQAKKQAGSTTSNSHVVLDGLAHAGLPAPKRIEATPSVLRVTFASPPARLPQDIVAPTNTQASTLEWRLDTP